MSDTRLTLELGPRFVPVPDRKTAEVTTAQGRVTVPFEGYPVETGGGGALSVDYAVRFGPGNMLGVLFEAGGGGGIGAKYWQADWRGTVGFETRFAQQIAAYALRAGYGGSHTAGMYDDFKSLDHGLLVTLEFSVIVDSAHQWAVGAIGGALIPMTEEGADATFIQSRFGFFVRWQPGGTAPQY